MNTFLNGVPPSFRFKAFLFFIFIIHALKILNFIPLEILGSPFPITQGEYFLDHVEFERTVSFLKESSAFSGYDPHVLGGYYSNPLLDSDRRFLILLALPLSTVLPPVYALKILEFLILLLSPLLLYGAARLFGCDQKQALLAFALCVAGFPSLFPLSRHLIENGYHLFILSTFFAVFVLGLYYRFLSSATLRLGIAFSFCLPVAFLIHKGSLIFLVPSLLLMTWSSRGKLRPRQGYIILVAFLSVFAINWFWISAILFHHPPYSKINWQRYQTHLGDIFTMYFPFSDWESTPKSLLRLYLLIASLVGATWLKKKNLFLSVQFKFWIILLGFIALFGSQITYLQSFLPRQYLFVFSLAQLIPATFFLLPTFWKPKTVRFLIFLAVLWFFGTYQIPAKNSITPLKTGYEKKLDEVIGYFALHPPQGRILFEDEINHYQSGRLLPASTPFLYIGPSVSFVAESEFQATLFRDRRLSAYPVLFGRATNTYDLDSVIDKLDQYNVSHVLAFSLQNRSLFDRYPEHFVPVRFPKKARRASDHLRLELQGHPGDFKPPPPPEEFRLYHVKGFVPNYLYKGEGEVTLTYNRIRIKNPGPGELILKCNWIKGLKPLAEVKMEPFFFENRSWPFIALTNNTQDTELVVTFK